jgi:cyclase
LKALAKELNVPVIACGGAGSLSDLKLAVSEGGASAAAAGSLFVFHGKRHAVLITYPSYKEISELFN